MASTPESRKRTHETNVERAGGPEAFRQQMRERAAKGGKARVPKGFSVTRKYIQNLGGLKAYREMKEREDAHVLQPEDE